MLGEDADSAPSLAARDSTLALAWTEADGARVRTWTGGSWSAIRRVGPPYDGSPTPWVDHRAAGVAIGIGGQVGVAWSACRGDCDPLEEPMANILWAESNDAGVTWFRGQVVCNLAAARKVNDAAAVVWPAAGRRLIVWNGYSVGEASYRMYLRAGSGTN